MNHIKYWSIVVSLTMFLACQEAEQGETVEQQEIQQTEETQQMPASPSIEQQKITLTSTLKELRVRDKAGLEGTEIARLDEGDKMVYADEMSDFTTEIKLRGVDYNDPWLKVELGDGKKGWVYAGAVKFTMNNAGKTLAEQIVTKRLSQFFGKEKVAKIEAYQKMYAAVTTDAELAKAYQYGVNLQTELNKELEGKVDMYNQSEMPDLFWIDESLPALETALVAEGTEYYLFFDYKALLEKATQTDGTADDEFANFQIQVNPLDSTEYFFKAWYLQTWDYGGYSLLGQEKHIDLFNVMEENLKKSTVFEKGYQAIKEEMMRDLTQNMQYGEGKYSILVEFDKIMAADYSFMTKDDNIALETRRKMFDDPEANKLELNMRDN